MGSETIKYGNGVYVHRDAGVCIVRDFVVPLRRDSGQLEFDVWINAVPSAGDFPEHTQHMRVREGDASFGYYKIALE